MSDKHYSVTTEGDTLVAETPFGTAEYDLKGSSEEATRLLTDDTDEWPDSFDLEEQWNILIAEIETALWEWKRGEL